MIREPSEGEAHSKLTPHGQERGKDLKSIKYFVERPFLLRADVLPFVVLYALAWSQVKLNSLAPEQPLGEEIVANATTSSSLEDPALNFVGALLLQSEGSFWLVLVVIAQLFTFLSTHWFIDFKALLHYSQRDKECFFMFQKRKFVYDPAFGEFKKVEYPVHHTFSFYNNAEGLTEWDIALSKYGRNIFDIPLPTFMELYREQALAPFFVFQIFCVLLWCLDEYWYYSLFTLFMVLVFEATVVTSRLRVGHRSVEIWKEHVRVTSGIVLIDNSFDIPLPTFMELY
ncbi:hypothetical protein PROFUN_15286, partial [Planoprotostelium fungivorum]